MNRNKPSFPYPPGRMGWPIIGETLSLILDPKFFEKRHNKYGNIFKTYLFGRPTISIAGKDASHFFLTRDNKIIEVSLPPSTKALLGESFIGSQLGEIHKSRRQIIYKAFHPRSLANYFNTLEKITRDYLIKWENETNLILYPELQNYTLDLACSFLMGKENASQTSMGKLYKIFSEGLFSFHTFRLPWTAFGRAWKSRQKILSEIELLIKQRQEQSDNQIDALGILLSAKDEFGEKLSLNELKDQLLGLLFAGQGTLTSALSSFCLLMAQYPDVLTVLRKEQQKFDSFLTSEQLTQMPYLDPSTTRSSQIYTSSRCRI